VGRPASLLVADEPMGRQHPNPSAPSSRMLRSAPAGWDGTE
jgi:hypothetical protein